MGDQLARAWNLLKPDERPEGMRAIRKGGSFRWRQGGVWHLTSRTARDRLIVAVEDVLMDDGTCPDKRQRGYCWLDVNGELIAYHTDRLTAACGALEAVRESEGQ